MNIIKAMNKARVLLDKADIEAPQLEAGMLMAHLMNCSRIHLYLDRDRILSEGELGEYFDMVDKRMSGIPIHYILGYREFMGLDFHVNESVLIPRPDTEVLVEYVIQFCKARANKARTNKNSVNENLRILDIGTGSGAIAVSLAKYIKNSQVTAIDIDNSALVTAKENAVIHGVEDRIDFLKGDLFAPLMNEDGEPKNSFGFDIMVSNPPYIPWNEIKELKSQVKDYEPLKALDGGEDGLDFYRRLAHDAPMFLNKGGLWTVEVGYNQSSRVADILRDEGCYNKIDFIKDLSGYRRVVSACICG